MKLAHGHGVRIGGILQAKGISTVLLACLVGAVAGVFVTLMSRTVQMMHASLFSLPVDVRLSGLLHLSSLADAVVPVAGGLIMGIAAYFLRRYRNRPLLDPIEANALYGGRMSLNDTWIVAAQTMISSGFGASVGLEAGFTQVGAGLASRLARALKLRRNDVRVLVGCGAAGAIAAAFGAPLTSAFYGFELIIGVYSLANVAPVMAAAVSASLMADWLGAEQFPIEVGAMLPILPHQYLPFLLLGAICAFASIAIMQLVTLVERGFLSIKAPSAVRPLLGGVIIGLLGMISPQILSSGHGAMHLYLTMHFSFWAIATVFVLKVLASVVSLGSGFRGGLFFASLFLGALLGNMFATLFAIVLPSAGIHTSVAAVVGMTSLAVGVVGGPLTMTFLALEATRDLSLTGIVLAAAIVSSLVVRSVFGYSFSTWRLHLRGETIRSAHDVGWMRNLTVRSMMRSDVRTVSENTSLAAFRILFPLGSAQRVIALKDGEEYAGMIFVPDAHADVSAEGEKQGSVRSLIRFPDTVLIPPMNAKAAADIFEAAKAEELAVVDSFRTRRVVGLMTEGHLMRRYAEELDKARRDLAGET
ncbi:chloride channel protein [Mesorhizobium liriopis]|uniref:chloride channel protein n=1 Tax=Mesorhizobium liriopis TaxID=2953882 RepID=UPI0025AF86B9|nr:chloride channel protein [Mesorhizobium liriopis]